MKLFLFKVFFFFFSTEVLLQYVESIVGIYEENGQFFIEKLIIWLKILKLRHTNFDVRDVRNIDINSELSFN